MQYDLTEEQRMLQDMVRRLAKEQVEPGAAKRDIEGKFDWEMVDLLRENGLIGIDFPEAYEGAGAGMLALAITVEELSRVDAACGLVPAVQELGSLPIMLAGNEEQKKRFLPKLASGEQLAAFGADRTRGRLRRGPAALQGGQRRRLLRDQRHQDLHLQRRRGRDHHPLRPHRSQRLGA